MNKRDWVEVLCRGAALLLLVLAVEASTRVFAHWLAWRDEPIPASWFVSPIGNFVAALILWFGASLFASTMGTETDGASAGTPMTRETTVLLVVTAVSLYFLLDYAYGMIALVVVPAIQGTLFSSARRDEPYDVESLLATLLVTALSGAVLYYSLRRLSRAP